MKAEGVRELAGMLFFQSTLRLRCILQAVRNIMAMSTYLRRLDGGWGEEKNSDNCKESAVTSRQTAFNSVFRVKSCLIICVYFGGVVISKK